MTAPRLTKRRLEAIAEALHHRLQGGIDSDDLDSRDYDSALAWADSQIARKASTAPSRKTESS